MPSQAEVRNPEVIGVREAQHMLARTKGADAAVGEADPLGKDCEEGLAWTVALSNAWSPSGS